MEKGLYEKEKEHARKMQEFQTTEYWNLIHSKLEQDWQKYRTSLIAENDEQTRGKIKYIEELFNYVCSTAVEVLMYNEIERVIKEENDY